MKNASYCLVGHAVINGNLAKWFLVLTDTAHHIRPFLRGNTLFRYLWAWTLLRGEERRNITKHLLECKQSSIELAMRGEKVN